MDGLDEGIKRLEIGARLLALSHIEYLKSKGKISSSLWEAIQGWETDELSGDKSKQSTLKILPFEVYLLELIVKELKQEVERMGNKEEED